MCKKWGSGLDLYKKVAIIDSSETEYDLVDESLVYSTSFLPLEKPEADEEEEEEHPAPANSVVVALTATDQAPSAEETEPFETDESAATPPP
nr:hypothetical protein [Tanacetum cinerariifolium]